MDTIQSLPRTVSALEAPKKPQTHSPFAQIPSYLLPSILTYIPASHLKYRLVDKEWDFAIQALHASDNCYECHVECKPDELHLRMPKLPWLLRWKTDVHTNFAEILAAFEGNLIPFLDSSQPECGYSITLQTSKESLFYASTLADWCLHHSKHPKYRFLLAAEKIGFETAEQFSAFLRSPSMNHVVALGLHPVNHDERKYSFAPFLDSEAMSTLNSLTISGCQFQPPDAECLIRSPYLTNLTHLEFYFLGPFDGMARPDRSVSFDTIICSPIMKSVKSFHLDNILSLEYSLVEAFGRSKYLKNLTHLKLAGAMDDDIEDWPLEPLLRCDSSLPNLTSLSLSYWPPISEADMRIIASPTSALFNRIKSFEVRCCSIRAASMKILCSSGGLQSLQRLALINATITDECVQFLASESSHHFAKLQYLVLSSWNHISNQSVVALYSSDRFSGLQCLELGSSINATPDIFEEIRRLPRRPSLKLTASFLFDVDEETRKSVQEELNMIC